MVTEKITKSEKIGARDARYQKADLLAFGLHNCLCKEKKAKNYFSVNFYQKISI